MIVATASEPAGWERERDYATWGKAPRASPIKWREAPQKGARGEEKLRIFPHEFADPTLRKN